MDKANITEIVLYQPFFAQIAEHQKSIENASSEIVRTNLLSQQPLQQLQSTFIYMVWLNIAREFTFSGILRINVLDVFQADLHTSYCFICYILHKSDEVGEKNQEQTQLTTKEKEIT